MDKRKSRFTKKEKNNINKVQKSNNNIKNSRITKKLNINRTIRKQKNTKLIYIFISIIVALMLFNSIKNSNNTKFLSKSNIKSPLDDMKIGDIVYYNPKIAVPESNSSKQNLRIERGDASTPGNGLNVFIAEVGHFNLLWRIFNINKDTKEIMLISDTATNGPQLTGAIGYIWGEKLLHDTAGLLGYGLGANLNMTYPYKVGSKFDENNDTETRYITGTGARNITAEDFESHLGIDDNLKKRSYFRYGNTTNAYIFTPLRNTGTNSSEFQSASSAQGNKKRYSIRDGKFDIKKMQIENNIFKDMLMNSKYNVATGVQYIKNNWLGYTFGYVTENNYTSDNNYVAYSFLNGNFRAGTITTNIRPIIHLKAENEYKKAIYEHNAWDIIRSKSDEIKKITFDVDTDGINLKRLPTFSLKMKNKEEIKYDLTSEANKLVSNVDVYYEQTRTGVERDSKFNVSKSEYILNGENIPADMELSIQGNAKNDLSVNLENSNYTIKLTTKKQLYKVNVNQIGGQDTNTLNANLKLYRGTKLIATKPVTNGVNEVSFGEVSDRDEDTWEKQEFSIRLEFAGENPENARYRLTVKDNKNVEIEYTPEEVELQITSTFTESEDYQPDAFYCKVVTLMNPSRRFVKKDNVLLEKEKGWRATHRVPKADKNGNKYIHVLELKDKIENYESEVELDKFNIKNTFVLNTNSYYAMVEFVNGGGRPQEIKLFNNTNNLLETKTTMKDVRFKNKDIYSVEFDTVKADVPGCTIEAPELEGFTKVVQGSIIKYTKKVYPVNVKYNDYEKSELVAEENQNVKHGDKININLPNKNIGKYIVKEDFVLNPITEASNVIVPVRFEMFPEFTELTEKIKKLEEDLAACRAKHAQKDTEITLLKAEIARLKLELEDAKNKGTLKDEEIQRLQQEKEALQTSLEREEKQNEENTKEIEKLKRELATVKAENETLKQDKENLERTISEKDNEIRILKGKNQEGLDRIQELEGQVSTLRNELESEKAKVRAKDAEIAEKNNTIQDLRNKGEQDTQRISQLEEQVRTLQAEVQTGKNTIKEKEDVIAEKDRTIQDLRTRLAASEQLNEEKQTKITKLERELQEAKDEINTLKGKNDTLSEKVTKQEEEINTLKNTLNTKDAKIAEL